MAWDGLSTDTILFLMYIAAHGAGCRHLSVASDRGFEAPATVNRTCCLQRWTRFPSIQGHEVNLSVPITSPQSLVSRTTTSSSGSRVYFTKIFTKLSEASITKMRVLNPLFRSRLCGKIAGRSEKNDEHCLSRYIACADHREKPAFSCMLYLRYGYPCEMSVWGCGYTEDMPLRSKFHLRYRSGIWIPIRETHLHLGR